MWILQNWKLIAAASIIATAYYVGWNMGSSSVEKDWNEEKAATQKELTEVAKKHAEVIQALEVQHDKDQLDIDYLRAHPRKLYLPATSCKPVANPVSSTETVAGTEPLPVSPQQAIDRYTNGVGELMYQADSVVNDCILMAEYLKSLRVDTMP